VAQALLIDHFVTRPVSEWMHCGVVVMLIRPPDQQEQLILCFNARSNARMHALTIRPIDRAALSGLCIPKMKTGDLRTDGEYHLAVDDTSARLNRSSFGHRASRLAMPAGAVCALIVVIAMTTFNNTSPSFPPIGAARGNVSQEVPPDDMAQADAANALSGLTERAADAVAKACAGTRT
jgi:hypothetical protein